MSQTIIRAPRRHRFVILDQQAVEDTRLSWAARGLLAYLLSRPDDWRVLINDLRKRGDLERDGIYKLLRELRDTGYVQFLRYRDEQGRIRGGTYLVQEIPTSPHPDLPDTAEPDTALPDPVKPEALPKTDRYLKQTTTTTPTTTKGGGSRSETENDRIEFASWMPDDLKASAIDKVARLEPASAQLVIDEWAGIMASGRGREVDRWVPVSPSALQTLARVAALQNESRNLIPPKMNYRQWRDHAYAAWRSNAKQYGLSGFHELRAAYACERYAQLTGSPAPAVSGGRQTSKTADRSARQVLSQELGHGRIGVMSSYVGSPH